MDKKKEKTKFKDRKLVVWAKEHAPDLVGGVLETTGTLLQLNVLKELGEKISQRNDLTPEEKQQAKELYELDLKAYEEENKDRANARNREIEIAKTGKTDWLMKVVGVSILVAFMFLVASVVYNQNLKDNPLAIHLIGLVEGLMTALAFYYFGSSKSSKDKTEMLNNK